MGDSSLCVWEARGPGSRAHAQSKHRTPPIRLPLTAPQAQVGRPQFARQCWIKRQHLHCSPAIGQLQPLSLSLSEHQGSMGAGEFVRDLPSLTSNAAELKCQVPTVKDLSWGHAIPRPRHCSEPGVPRAGARRLSWVLGHPLRSQRRRCGFLFKGQAQANIFRCQLRRTFLCNVCCADPVGC